MSPSPGEGPILIAYDGSELAKRAIAEMQSLLRDERHVIVACVWQQFDVGFTPVDEEPFNAEEVSEVRAAAERTAAAGAALVHDHGSDAEALAVEGANIPEAIIATAEEHDASLIVLGSRGRSGVLGALLGSVADAVVNHSHRTLLIVHTRDADD